MRKGRGLGGFSGAGRAEPVGYELNEYTSWRTTSGAVSGTLEGLKRLGAQARATRQIYEEGVERGTVRNYGGFMAGLRATRGQIGGQLGRDVNGIITGLMKGISHRGGKDIGSDELARLIESAASKISDKASKATGVEKDLVQNLANELVKASHEAASSGGFRGMKGSSLEILGASFGFKSNSMIDEALKNLSAGMDKTAKTLGDPSIATAIEHIRDEMNRAAAAASNQAEKQEAAANAVAKITGLGTRAGGSDKTSVEGLAASSSKIVNTLQTSLKQQSKERSGLRWIRGVEDFKNALGNGLRYLQPLKRTIDITNAGFQQINSRINQFARMQIKIAGERAGYGRSVRGAGINFQDMMASIGAGRAAGMEDSAVVAQMVGLQTRLAQARWGEGGLPEDAGKWGISVYGPGGEVKQGAEMMIEFSRKLRSLGTDMEKLQFLSAMGFRPEQMEYVKNYEDHYKRMEFLKKNPHLQGVLDRADILDESGLNARADAATKIELRRRQIENQNAIEQGIIPGLKRSLNPENWLFNDWTARQHGVRVAKSEDATQRLTKAIETAIAQRKQDGRSRSIGAGLFTADDLANLAAVRRADIADKKDQSGFAIMADAYRTSYGLQFDIRTPIQKLQDALTPLINKAVDWLEKIASSKLAQGAEYAAENPGKTLAWIVAAIAALKGGRVVLGKVGGKILDKGIDKGVAGAGGFFSRLFGGGGAKASEKAMETLVPTAAPSPSSLPRTGSAVKSWWSGLFNRGRQMSTVPKGADETLAQLNSSQGLGLNLGSRGSAAEKSFEGFVHENPHLSSSAKAATDATKAGAKAAGKEVASEVGKGAAKGLKLVGKGVKGSIPGLLLSIPELITAAGEYKKGDTKSGNRTVGGVLGGVVGGAATGAAIGSIVPGAGTLVGSIVGGIVGFLGGEKLADAVSEGLAVQGSEAWSKEQQGWQKGDIIANPKKAGEEFIKGLREALKNNDLTRAVKMLNDKGISIDASILKNDEKFMQNDSYANQVMQSAADVSMAAQYAVGSGKSIGPKEFAQAAESDKYMQAARQEGLTVGTKDVVGAALRATGNEGVAAAAPSREVIENYIEHGWKGDATGLAQETAKIMSENPQMTLSDAQAQAEKNKKAEHLKNLTQQDFRNYVNAIGQEKNDIVEYGDIVDEASRYGMDQTGVRRNEKGQLMDEEGYLVDTAGARVDEEGRHEGEEGYKETRVGEALSQEGKKAATRLKEYRAAHGNADNLDISGTSEERKAIRDAWFGLSEEERQQQALQQMSGGAMGDVLNNRTFEQKFDNEQFAEFQDFMKSPESANRSAAGNVMAFATKMGVSQDAVRNMLNRVKGTGKLTQELWDEAKKGSEGQRESRASDMEQKKKDREAKYQEMAESATDEEISNALKGDEGQIEYYKELRDKKARGEGLTENEQKAFEETQRTIGSRVAGARRTAASQPLNAEVELSPEEQQEEEEFNRRHAEAEASFDEQQKSPYSIADMTSFRMMWEDKKKGKSREEIERRYGHDMIEKFNEAREGGHLEELGIKDMSTLKAEARAKYEAKVRAGLEATNMSGEHLEATVADRMQEWDETKGEAYDKAASKGDSFGGRSVGGEKGPGGFIQEANNKTQQVSSIMASAGTQAENAAQSATKFGGDSANGNSHTEITNNNGGQQVVINMSAPTSDSVENIRQAGYEAGNYLAEVAAEISNEAKMSNRV